MLFLGMIRLSKLRLSIAGHDRMAVFTSSWPPPISPRKNAMVGSRFCSNGGRRDGRVGREAVVSVFVADIAIENSNTVHEAFAIARFSIFVCVPTINATTPAISYGRNMTQHDQ